MKVVCNSSVLIALSGIDRLEILHKRFLEGVIVPEAVWHEVFETGHGRAGAENVANAKWITCRKIQNFAFATALQTSLDEGEGVRHSAPSWLPARRACSSQRNGVFLSWQF